VLRPLGRQFAESFARSPVAQPSTSGRELERGELVRLLPEWDAGKWSGSPAAQLHGANARFRFLLQDLKMPNPKDDPKSPEWRPYIFARDQWHCRICGDRFQYSWAASPTSSIKNSENSKANNRNQ
jgi:hypothetical protein